MADLNDETIVSVLHDKESIDSLLDKSSSSSSSFDALLEKSPIKSDNLKNNLTFDNGSSSDEETVKSARRKIKAFSESDSELEADKENVQNILTPKRTGKQKNSSDSEDDTPRKSRLVYNDSSDEDTSSKNVETENNKRKESKLAAPANTSKANDSSDSEDNIITRKSKLIDNDSSDDNITKKDSKLKSPSKTSDQNASSGSDTDTLPKKSRLVVNDDSSDDDIILNKKSMKKNKKNTVISPKISKQSISSDSEDDMPQKSRLVLSNNDSSDCDNTSKNESARISDKRSKLHNKFKGLLKSRSKVSESNQKSPLKSLEDKDGSNSDDSGSGIESIKQKIKQKSMLLKSGICDPDTSSDEESSQIQKQMKKKPTQKSAIMISPKEQSKPARMSAKQAMENMQKIKSESNRMLREKEVSLPYHRPKALSLKDIMNRRRPAVSADGKALPVKMNSEQLKQYVKLLEQRNKEMMELCKSESEDEEETNDTLIEDKNEPDLNSSTGDAKDTKEVSDDITEATKDEKPEEHSVPALNEEQETNENDLPDLTIEIVQKEPDLSNNDVAVKELLTTDTTDRGSPNKDTVDKNLSDIDIVDKDSSSTAIVEKCDDVEMKDASEENITEIEPNTKLAAEIESQLMELRYETEKMQNTEELDNKEANGYENEKTTDMNAADKDNLDNNEFDDDFEDVDINMEDLESIIENAKDAETAVDSPMLIREPFNLNKKPKLTGAPGMVIDLDGSNPVGPKKLSGVELLKERFTYFAKLKTPEEKEREREVTIKPGMQHFKLRQDLEEKISEQRSLEWAKRLEEEKQQHEEMNAMRGDDSDVDDLEKIEAKLEEKEDVLEELSSDSEEEELVENDCDMTDKPRKKNPMVDDEAEVSDVDGNNDKEVTNEPQKDDGIEDADDEDEDEESDESSDESSDDEENQTKPKKGRILKAFEDSDDESITLNDKPSAAVANSDVNDTPLESQNSEIVKDSQDDVIPLAQTNQSISEDLFASQTSGNPSTTSQGAKNNSGEDFADITTQTFSILNSNTPDLSTTEKVANVPTKIDVIFETQPAEDANLDDVVGMCSGKFTQTQNMIAESQTTDSQIPIGDDILAMCTGQFYDNQFVSQVEPEKDKLPKETFTEKKASKPEEKDLLDSILQEMDEPVADPNRKKIVFDNAVENEAVSFDAVNHMRKKFTIDSDDESNVDGSKPAKKKKLKKRKLEKRALQISDWHCLFLLLASLSSMLRVRRCPQCRMFLVMQCDVQFGGGCADLFRPSSIDHLDSRTFANDHQLLEVMAFFPGNVPEEYDEDEEELLQSDEEGEDMSEVDENNGEERIVEYDSEENEVEVKPQKQKKNRKMAEFFENEAELTSEDEWMGSGDEDERGLDRMEREDGDDDTFHQGQLQRELGQIHMRDVLDQDKREVRLIQELLFEDGDLGDGGRQRKFRWKNLDGETEPETVPGLFADSQQEEYESEEQWRKQRHEREVFLRSLKEKESEEHISIDRSTIIKANLCSRTMSSVLMEANGTSAKVEETVVVKKQAVREEARNKPLTVFQQSYHGSLLTRGRGALARLAALALPLAGEADVEDRAAKTAGPGSSRNFVFAAVTPPVKEAKAPKRKADNVNIGTPRLIKKMKTDDQQKLPKLSLLDHLKAL